eukprot:scaffold328155_cov71-Tisochrysis_lutea.AAC.2
MGGRERERYGARGNKGGVNMENLVGSRCFSPESSDFLGFFTFAHSTLASSGETIVQYERP